MCRFIYQKFSRVNGRGNSDGQIQRSERAGHQNGTGKEDKMSETATTQTAEQTTQSTPATPDATQQTAEQAQQPTFDDILQSDKRYQSEFDKRVNKAMNTALETARAKWEADAKARADEAAKLAKMSAEQKAEHERQKREEELTRREAKITAREVHAEAVTQLTEKGLPAILADILDCSSAEKCAASMEKVEKAFNDAVQKAVNGKLSQAAPKAATKNTVDPFLVGFGT